MEGLISSDTAVTVKEASLSRAHVLPALSVLTASGLAFEVGLTRLFSFLFVQSTVYIIVTLSVAGLGLGAVAMAYVPRRLRTAFLKWSAVLPPLLLTLLYLTAMRVSSLAVSLVAMVGVYAALGAAHLHLFRSSGVSVSRLYAADLIGAAAGSVASFLLLNALGAPDALVVIAAGIGIGILLIAAAFGASRRHLAVASAAVLGVTTLGFLLPFEETVLPEGRWEKEMTAMLEDGGQILETRWTAFGRVDLVGTDNPLFQTMFIDGGAGTKMIRMESGRVTREVAQTLLYQYMGGIPLLPLERENRGRAAVVGAGGGIDVVTLLLAGFRQIDAIEINPEFVAMVGDYGEYSGDLYSAVETVQVHVAEGRSFLRRSDAPYDLILMSLPIIKSVRNYGNHALTENYLFTREAFGEYLEALGSDGRAIFVTHYPNELLRLVTNALAAFEAAGVTPSEAISRFVLVGDRLNPTLVMAKDPFPRSQRDDYAAIIEAIPTIPGLSFVPGMAPGVNAAQGFNPELLAIEAGEGGIETLIGSADENISPVTDESPFFYQLEGRIPPELTTVGIAILLLLLLLATAYVVPSRPTTAAQSYTDRASRLRTLTAFVALGLGYIMVEIVVIQRFIVFWNHQTLALAVALSAILLASGVGSIISGSVRSRWAFSLVIAWIALAGAAVAFGLRPLLETLEGAGPGARVALTATVAFLIFVPMGIPFPLVLRSTPHADYPWAMAANSIATVAGGVLSLMVATSGGYRVVALIGMIAYAAVFIAVIGSDTSFALPRKEKKPL